MTKKSTSTDTNHGGFSAPSFLEALKTPQSGGQLVAITLLGFFHYLCIAVTTPVHTVERVGVQLVQSAEKMILTVPGLIQKGGIIGLWSGSSQCSDLLQEL